jgi:hypothetical protein
MRLLLAMAFLAWTQPLQATEWSAPPIKVWPVHGTELAAPIKLLRLAPQPCCHWWWRFRPSENIEDRRGAPRLDSILFAPRSFREPR